jgi:hypothetical protein
MNLYSVWRREKGIEKQYARKGFVVLDACLLVLYSYRKYE